MIRSYLINPTGTLNPKNFWKDACIFGQVADVLLFFKASVAWLMWAVHFLRACTAAFGVASCVVFSLSIFFIGGMEYRLVYLVLNTVLLFIAEIMQEDAVATVGALEGWCALALGPLGLLLFSMWLLLASEELPRCLLLWKGVGLLWATSAWGRPSQSRNGRTGGGTLRG